MTAKEAQALIGQTGSYRVGTIAFKVVVNDVKAAFGRIDVQIMPLNGQGEGQTWVDANNLGGLVMPGKGKK